MAYAWIAFYEKNQFIKEVPQGRPPWELPDPAGGRPLRLTSLQLYDHQGRIFIEQNFDGIQRPILAQIRVPTPDRAETVPCHILGWQETAQDETGQLLNLRHLAHVVEDGRIIMTSAPADEALFQRPYRRLLARTRPYTWVAVYDHLEAAPALYQYHPATGIEVSSEHIDRRRLRSLILTDQNGDPWIEQVYAPGQRVIYRRRVEQPTHSFDPLIVFLLGWQQTVRDARHQPVNIQHVAYVLQQSGITLMAGAFDEAHPIFHGITEVPADRTVVGIDGAQRTEGVGRD